MKKKIKAKGLYQMDPNYKSRQNQKEKVILDHIDFHKQNKKILKDRRIKN